MTGWSRHVEAPFRDDPQFWTAVGRCADALWALVAATVLTTAFGWAASLAYVVPAVLLVAGGRVARVSTARTRSMFASRAQWRDAERTAVAAAIPGALVRYPRRFLRR